MSARRIRESAPRELAVVAGVLRRGGRYMIARRRCGRHAGLWEFPGGKLEPGETAAQALRREFTEEFGVSATAGEELGRTSFRTAGRRVSVVFLAARCRARLFDLRDHTAVAWLTPEQLLRKRFAPGDRPFLRSLQPAAAAVVTRRCPAIRGRGGRVRTGGAESRAR
jgi:mutator protein MutT